MKEKNKFIVWLKRLPIGLTGLVAFIGIMLLLTAIFNWFWTGLGTDPTRTFYAPFTNKFSDFKEYAALYIPLISFGATLFAGFVVFLVFNDWKEQHNAEIDKEEIKEIKNTMGQISVPQNDFIKSIEDPIIRANLIMYGNTHYIKQEDWSDFINNVKILSSLFYEFNLHNKDKKLKKISLDYFSISEIYIERTNVFLNEIKSTQPFPEKLNTICTDFLLEDREYQYEVFTDNYEFFFKGNYLNLMTKQKEYFDKLYLYIIENKLKI